MLYLYMKLAVQCLFQFTRSFRIPCSQRHHSVCRNEYYKGEISTFRGRKTDVSGGYESYGRPKWHRKQCIKPVYVLYPVRLENRVLYLPFQPRTCQHLQQTFQKETSRSSAHLKLSLMTSLLTILRYIRYRDQFTSVIGPSIRQLTLTQP